MNIDNQLLYALALSEDDREDTIDLNTGYVSDEKMWELIVKYNEDIVWPDYVSDLTLLNGTYATLKIRQSDIERLALIPQIYYIEKPKDLYFDISNAKNSSCITSLQVGSARSEFTGRGVLVAIIDSGIDYTHPVFRNDDLSTRIVALWDQNDMDSFEEQGFVMQPPVGYSQGILYTQEMIDYALTLNDADRRKMIRTGDFTGHGTAVAGIAATIANEAGLLVVRLKSPALGVSGSTASMMEALNWVNDTAMNLNMPVAVNISFGNNYGAHNGKSLLESFVDSQSMIGRNCIVIGTGNEGVTRLHFEDKLDMGTKRKTSARFFISYVQQALNIQLWKNYIDVADINLVTPQGESYRIRKGIKNIIDYRGMKIYAFISEPTPYNELEEVYFEFIRKKESSFLEGGIYSIEIEAKDITDGRINMWMPSGNVVASETGFFNPSSDTTLTIPSTAASAVTVGAYNSRMLSESDYSGRGFLVNGLVKPDIVAPGNNILSATVGGGYEAFTGTSFATPVVTGACALLMSWGIIGKNDVNMYGQKVKAALLAGADRKLLKVSKYPDASVGWGSLCLENTIRFIT